MAVDRVPGVDTWSFGMVLCMLEPGEEAVILEIAPHETVGSGFEEVGTAINEFTWSGGGSATISADGFPPSHAPSPVPANGHVIDTDCASLPGDGGAEVLVGLHATGDDGGGWRGAYVTYTVGDAEYVLEIRNDMLICGDAVAEGCESAPPS